MKLTYKSAFSHLRIAAAVTLMSAAAALAFVAVNPSGPLLLGKSDNQAAINKLRENRVELFRNKLALPGAEREGGPATAALEEFAHRAIPLNDVPTEASQNAISGFNRFVATTSGVGNGKKTVGAWHLIGPSTAVDPSILTFSGAQYVTSGRITALAISPNCGNAGCRVWAAAAGGGVWRTDNALSGSGANWTFISGSFDTNAIGSLLLDPNDSTHNTIYAGTGEPNASGDSEAGVGVYKSTDGGNTWALFPGTGIFFQRSIGQMDIDNNGKLLVPIASGVRGVSSVTGGASSSAATGHPLATRGLYRCDGTTCTLIRPIVAVTTARGSTTVKVDPTNAGVIYVNEFSRGVWRSTDNGTTWTQIKNPLNSGLSTDRAEFAVTTIPGGFTRMYVGVGNSSIAACPTCDGGSNQARLYRTDNAVTATNADFTDLTAVQEASLVVDQTLDYCGDPLLGGAQCWYDNVVYSPPGKPDVVYLGGAFAYSRYGFRNNGRAFVRSTNAGATFTDMTWDATTNPAPAGSCCQPNPIAPNGMHPDQHAIVEIPGTNAAIFGSDGGLMRSSGVFTDISSQCDSRPISPLSKTSCHQMLSAVPTFLYNANKGLSTIQFQSVSVAPDNSKHVQGGNQDNGTFETYGSNVSWPQIIYGDGGQSGFSVTNSSLRFNSFSGQFHDGNFQNADPSKWVIISGPIAGGPEGGFSNFYVPIIADPATANAGTILEGSAHVWRTQDWGGNQAFLELNCPEFTTPGTKTSCGDFVPLGGAAGFNNAGDLEGTFYGADRAGAPVAALARTPSNTGTLWAATNTGRVFISDNADASAASVTWFRLDPSSTVDPNRFVSSIYVDPTNANHAWISYSGYNVNTPTTPGHVFEVTRTPASATATWTNISYNLPDFPITGLVRDDVTGDLYAASDFGVMILPNGSTTWSPAGTGLPMVEVAGLTIVPGSRILYAATHGRSAWSLTLP